jgi:hypothetical protein
MAVKKKPDLLKVVAFACAVAFIMALIVFLFVAPNPTESQSLLT